MSDIIDARYDFLEKQAIRALPFNLKKIYLDMANAEVELMKRGECEKTAMQVVAKKHNMSEDEVKEIMMIASDFIETYIEKYIT